MSSATNKQSHPSRGLRFPVTLATLAVGAIAVPLYLGMGGSADLSVDPSSAEQVATSKSASAVTTPTTEEVRDASSAAVPTPSRSEPLAMPSAKEEEAPPPPAGAPLPSTASLDGLAPAPKAGGKRAARPMRKGKLEVDGRFVADEAAPAIVADKKDRGGFNEQLRVNRLTAGRTSDLDDRKSIDALRTLAVAQDPALAQAIVSNKAIGTSPSPGDAPTTLDIGLVLDTTGSMGDELAYLKVELRAIAQTVAVQYPDVTQRYALVAYRDQGDDYVVRHHDFESIDGFLAHLGQESAGGGGDTPEAMDKAMATAAQLQWSSSEAAQMVFLVADAPPHAADYTTYVEATGSLGARGIAVYPVASSGVATVCEYLMRWAARTTGGQYIFLTDHSGIGGAHAEAHVEEYKLKTLRDHMLEVIRLELGSPADQAARVATNTGAEKFCGLYNGRNSGHAIASWFDRHGTVLVLFGGVFLLGFAVDMARDHARRRAQS